jgi:hypothetical protein
MRPNLLHPLADKRRPARVRTGPLAALAHRRVSGTHAPVAIEAERDPRDEAARVTPAPSPTGELQLAYDRAARRVREAGGPLDEASYSCACGYVFAASVSTSVCCPHCGARQAW